MQLCKLIYSNKYKNSILSNAHAIIKHIFFSLKKNHEIRSEKMNGIMSSPIMALIIAFVLNISVIRLEKKPNIQSHLNRYDKKI